MKPILKLTLCLISILLFSSCAVEGDEISGIWYTNGDLGPMKIEIKPTGGKFVGYLLEQEVNGTFIQGGTEQKDIIFDGLRFKDDKYLGGKFLKNPKGTTPCGFKLAFYTQDKKTMRAGHHCNGVNRLEYFERDGYPEKPEIETNVNTISLDQLLKANPNNKENK